MSAPLTLTVQEMIDLLAKAMCDHDGRTLRISKRDDGVYRRITADRGKDVRDFLAAKIEL